MIVDGTGNPWFRADVGIRDGMIQVVGDLSSCRARRVIDASGLAVCPGFIDMHSHSDIKLLEEPQAKAKVLQGVTTELLGQDGCGVAPLCAECEVEWRASIAGLVGTSDIKWDWRSFEDYLRAIGGARPSVNVAVLLSYGALRLEAMGLEERRATPLDIEAMQRTAREAMLSGAFGMSLGMVYYPCILADVGELSELCKAVAEYRGILVIHMWNESDMLLDSIERSAHVARSAGVPLHISHFKVAGRQNWGRAAEALSVVESLRGSGLDVTFDQYPYVAASTMLTCILPPWSLTGGAGAMVKHLSDPSGRERIRRDIEEGIVENGMMWDNDAKLAGWEGLVIASVASEKNRRWEGQSLKEISKERGVHPADAAMDLILEEQGAVTVVEFLASEEDVRTIMKSRHHMACSDGIYGGKPHPRLYGTFPRILGRYVREEGVLQLEEAVRHMTWMPARRLGLRDRGLILDGMAADIVVFDPAAVRDTATYADPVSYPEGIDWVLVNGEVVVEQGAHTGARPGRVLRK